MNRKKEIYIYVILIPLLLFSFMRLGNYYFSPKAVLDAYEKGLCYGPSEEILAEYELLNREKLLIGKWENNLSLVSVKPAFGVFWKASMEGINGLYPCEKEVMAYVFENGRIVGLTQNEEISKVYCEIQGEFEGEKVFLEMLMNVDAEGFYSEDIHTSNFAELHGQISYVEGRSEEGMVLYQDGITQEGIYYQDGMLKGFAMQE